jgi:uncharacterized membrane protein YpjA
LSSRDGFWEFLHGLKASRAWALVFLVPNLVGIGFGYYYYWQVGQFDPSSSYFRAYGWWPFISDSPNAVLLMTVAWLLYAFGRRRSKVLDAVAFTAMAYVGLWTTFLFVAYADQMGTYQWASVLHGNANPILFVSHMGMPLEALLLVRDLRRDAWAWIAAGGVLGWNVLNLLLDYWGPHLHPAPFLHDPQHLPPLASTSDAVLHAGSPLLMALTLAAWLAVVWKGLGKRVQS